MMPQPSMPAASQGSSQGTPPAVGSSPATMPMPSKGNEAAGMARLGLIVRMIEDAIPLLGASSEAGMALIKALPNLAKQVPSGAVSPSTEKNAMEQMMMKQRQLGPQIAQMRQPAPQQQPPAMPSPAGEA